MTTITPSGGSPGDGEPERSLGWVRTLIDFIRPAIYGGPWSPFIRIMIAAVVIFVGAVVWRLLA